MCCKKGVLRNFAKFTGKHLCQSFLFCNFLKKETRAQEFSCKFCEISRNTFFTEHLRATASVRLRFCKKPIHFGENRMNTGISYIVSHISPAFCSSILFFLAESMRSNCEILAFNIFER